MTREDVIVEDLEGEVWKDVVGWEGHYQVSNKARVHKYRTYMEPRKPIVLVLNGAPNDATSFYRSSGVFPYINGVEFIYSSNVDWSTIIGCDIVFCPRPYTQNMVSICKYVKICKKQLWTDLDDDHFNVIPSNPSYKDLTNPVALECHRTCIKMSDVVTVTTKALKDVVLQECPTANVLVIPNCVNDFLFDFTPSYHTGSKIVLIRGGSSHEADIESYKEPILKLIADHPEYKWAFMGYCPRFVIDSGISDDRLMIFQYTDLMKYFETLTDLKPEIMIVPLEDNEFNKSKSNIAWIEGTIAGATVIAPNYLPEFDRHGCLSSGDFVKSFEFLVSERDFRFQMYESSLNSIPRLSVVNQLRLDVIEKLSKKKFKFSTKNEKISIPATDQEFFNVCLTHGHIQENKSYEEMHRKTVDWLIEKIKPKTVVEFGSGPGPTIEYFIDRGVSAYGLEMNPKFIEYWDKRNPHLSSNIMKCDFINDPLELEEVADLGVSIEVFEHIKQSENDWDKFIIGLSKQFKHFFFSSTPFREKPTQDLFWGHVNIRTTTSWIKLFERNGWELVTKPMTPTGWTLLFKSKNV